MWVLLELVFDFFIRLWFEWIIGINLVWILVGLMNFNLLRVFWMYGLKLKFLNDMFIFLLLLCLLYY